MFFSFQLLLSQTLSQTTVISDNESLVYVDNEHLDQPAHMHSLAQGYKTFFMLNSAEHEIYFADNFLKLLSCSTQLSMCSAE